MAAGASRYTKAIRRSAAWANRVLGVRAMVRSTKQSPMRKAVARVLAAILAVVILGCGHVRNPDAAANVAPVGELYPSWFVETPVRENAVFAVGYAPIYGHIESSYEEAHLDARANLGLAHRASIRGDQAFEARSGEVAYRGSNIKQLADSSLSVRTAFLDTVVVGRTMLVLAASAKGAVDDKPIEITVAPGWLTELPVGGGLDYAVGRAPRYFREATSWQRAEAAARSELARMQVVRSMQLSRKTGSELSEITVEEINVVLERPQIVARHIDAGTGVHYVLACCLK